MKEDSWSSGHRKSIVLSSSNQNGSTVTVGLLCWAAAALPQHRNYSTQSQQREPTAAKAPLNDHHSHGIKNSKRRSLTQRQ